MNLIKCLSDAPFFSFFCLVLLLQSRVTLGTKKPGIVYICSWPQGCNQHRHGASICYLPGGRAAPGIQYPPNNRIPAGPASRPAAEQHLHQPACSAGVRTHGYSAGISLRQMGLGLLPNVFWPRLKPESSARPQCQAPVNRPQ